jgi:hypothetical protein
VPGAGHMSAIEAPDAIAAVLLELVQKIEVARRSG